MREYPGPEGDPRIWYEPDEIEDIFEGELRRAKLVPRITSPVVEVERFIESHLKVRLDQFAELPSDVLGLTTFDGGKSPVISISGELSESAESNPSNMGIVGRWRATLAHEAAHVVLHRYLFDPAMARLQHPLAATTVKSAGLFRCSNGDIDAVSDSELARRNARSDWREVQANKGMAALLMPRALFNRVRLLTQGEIFSSLLAPTPSEREELVARLSSMFRVSKQMTSIRLETLSGLS